MSGIPLVESFHWFIHPSGMQPTPTHIAYSVPEDEAREAVVAAALRVHVEGNHREAMEQLDAACAVLIALTKGDA